MPSARKLGRSPDHRRAMLRGMTTLLLDKGRIETTVWRAKELKRTADKMITIGKKNTLAAKRAALAYITKEEVVKKLFDQIAPSFEDRNGGYTRVLKLGPRRGDGAEMAIIELVNYTLKDKSKKDKKAKKETKETKDTKDTKEKKDDKKETKETKEAKDTKKPAAAKKVKEPKKVEEEAVAIAEETEIIEEVAEIENSESDEAEKEVEEETTEE